MALVKKRRLWFPCLGIGILFLIANCGDDTTGPRELLDKYFSSALKQEYGTTYTCYYGAYQAKVSREEFIRHRQKASLLQSYKVKSLRLLSSDTATAEVQLTFGPSEQLKRPVPVTVMVKEELIKENGAWKIKVW